MTTHLRKADHSSSGSHFAGFASARAVRRGDFWLHNPNKTTIICARNNPALPTRCVDFGLRSASHAPPGVRQLAAAPPQTQTSSSRCLAPRATHRPSGSVTAGPDNRKRSVLTRQKFLRCPRPVATQLIISNRSACRLEMPETYRKQTTATRSNRHKCRHHFHTCCRPGRSRLPIGHNPKRRRVQLRTRRRWPALFIGGTRIEGS
jgi:hypothetical protein